MANLSVEAELVIERESTTYRVYSEGERLVVEAPSLSALRGLGDVRDLLPDELASLDSGLRSAGLSVDLRVRRATVARLGSGVRGGTVGRWLTGTDAAVDPRGIVTAIVRALG